jgi:hypothetical protein
MGYWEWLWADHEEFIDLNTGIYYKAHGNTRSLKGLFRNFDLPARNETVENTAAIKLLERLIDTGKITKQDLIEQAKDMPRLVYHEKR